MTKFVKKIHAQKFFELQLSFKIMLPEKLTNIEKTWILERDKSNPDFRDLHLKAHSLVGTAGTFNAHLVSEEARKIEKLFKSLLYEGLVFNESVIVQFKKLFSTLTYEAEKWQPSEIPFIPEEVSESTSKQSNDKINVVLVEDDVDVARSLIDYLESANYKIFYYRDINKFEKDYKNIEKVSAIIMDMAFDEGHVAGAETIKRLSENTSYLPAIIFISVHEDINARLAAAQAGARKYFTKPIDLDTLFSTLDELTQRIKVKPYRVVLIDDEESILDYYGTILRENGMDVLTIRKPIDEYHAIESFDPEIIILDLYMEECSGFDLARVIRQNNDFIYTPIVFLSSELDVGIQSAAMNLGGDDFILKPVDQEYFTQAILSRVKRAREMINLNSNLQNTLRENKFQLISLDKHAVVTITDISGNITFVNDHFINISGYSEEELLGKNHRIMKSGMHPDLFYKELWETISAGKIWSGHICNKSKNNNYYWLETTIVPFLNDHGTPYKFVSIRTDITKIKAAEINARESEIAFKAAKKEAERANTAKSTFLARMSHELRTPLNAVHGFAQLLELDRNRLSEDQKSNVDQIINASSHMMHLINESLELSTIESGNIILLIKEINCTEIVIECISLFTPLLEKQNISLKIETNDKVLSMQEFNAVKIKVDELRFKEVLLNLLSNAVKYNVIGGSIIVRLEKIENTSMRISVIDTGKGISAEMQPHLFTPFNRLSETDSTTEGTGIGLMIVKNITELMGGQIGYKSELSKGSTFWVEFPLA